MLSRRRFCADADIIAATLMICFDAIVTRFSRQRCFFVKRRHLALRYAAMRQSFAGIRHAITLLMFTAR